MRRKNWSDVVQVIAGDRQRSGRINEQQGIQENRGVGAWRPWGDIGKIAALLGERGHVRATEEGVVVAQTFVVQEKEGPVVAIIDMRNNDRPAQAGPILVAMEGRDLGLKKFRASRLSLRRYS